MTVAVQLNISLDRAAGVVRAYASIISSGLSSGNRATKSRLDSIDQHLGPTTRLRIVALGQAVRRDEPAGRP